MERLKTFEGVPPPYDKKKRVVVPQALRVLRLKPGRKYCSVGRLGHEFGWKYQDIVSRFVAPAVHLQPEARADSSLIGSRRGGRSSLPHTTSARRLRAGSWPRPRRRPRSTRRSRSSSPRSATRRLRSQGLGSLQVDEGRRRRPNRSYGFPSASYIHFRPIEWVSCYWQKEKREHLECWRVPGSFQGRPLLCDTHLRLDEMKYPETALRC